MKPLFRGFFINIVIMALPKWVVLSAVAFLSCKIIAIQKELQQSLNH